MVTKMNVRFDDSLPKLCEFISKEMGIDLLSRSAILRDAGGRLSIVLPERIGESRLVSLESKLKSELKAYARPDGTISDISYPGAERLLSEAARQPITNVQDFSIKLLERRIVGSDWLRSPTATATKTPRIVFTSL